MTNEVRNAVSAASRNSAMVVPFHITKTYGEELYWWKGNDIAVKLEPLKK